MRRRIIVVALALLGACQRVEGTPCDDPLEPTREPQQEAITDEPPLQLRAAGTDFVLDRRARYRLAARVLSRERYYWGWRSDLSPLDLALGWGYMADPGVDRDGN